MYLRFELISFERNISVNLQSFQRISLSMASGDIPPRRPDRQRDCCRLFQQLLCKKILAPCKNLGHLNKSGMHIGEKRTANGGKTQKKTRKKIQIPTCDGDQASSVMRNSDVVRDRLEQTCVHHSVFLEIKQWCEVSVETKESVNYESKSAQR